MTSEIINNAILYLSGSIENFIVINDLLKSTKNQKEKTKLEGRLYDTISDAKLYIKENQLYKIALDANDKLEKIYLDGMKPSYFEKDLKGLINSLIEKSKNFPQ